MYIVGNWHQMASKLLSSQFWVNLFAGLDHWTDYWTTGLTWISFAHAQTLVCVYKNCNCMAAPPCVQHWRDLISPWSKSRSCPVIQTHRRSAVLMWKLDATVGHYCSQLRLGASCAISCPSWLKVVLSQTLLFRVWQRTTLLLWATVPSHVSKTSNDVLIWMSVTTLSW